MRSFGLGVLDVEKLLLGGGHAAVPGARAVAPLDAGVVLRLPPAHDLLHRPVCPETLVRGGDEARDGEAARDLCTADTITTRPGTGGSPVSPPSQPRALTLHSQPIWYRWLRLFFWVGLSESQVATRSHSVMCILPLPSDLPGDTEPLRPSPTAPRDPTAAPRARGLGSSPPQLPPVPAQHLPAMRYSFFPPVSSGWPHTAVDGAV